MILYFSSLILLSNARLLDELPSRFENLKAFAKEFDSEDPRQAKYNVQLAKVSNQLKEIRADKSEKPFSYQMKPIQAVNYSSNYQQMKLFSWSPYGTKQTNAFWRSLIPSIRYTFFKKFPYQPTNHGNGWKKVGIKGNFTFAFEESNRFIKKYKKIDSILIRNSETSKCSIKSFLIYTINLEDNDKYGPFNLEQGVNEISLKSYKNSIGFKIGVFENNGDDSTCLENGVYVKE